MTATESLDRLNLFAALYSPVHGRVTAVSTASHEIDFSIQKDKLVCVTLIFEKIPLLLGAFHFNISLYGPTSLDFYHRASGIGNFRIVGPPIRSDGRGIEGITKLPYRWKIGE